MRLLFFLMCQLSPVVPQTSEEIAIGVVSDQYSTPQAEKVLTLALEDINAQSNLNYSMRGVHKEIAMCATSGLQMGEGAFQLCEMKFKENITAVIGPTCYKDMEIGARLTNQWNIIQFNIWSDHPSDGLDNNVVQMTSHSIINIVTNLIATLQALEWEQVAIFGCPTCYDSAVEGASRIEYIKNAFAEQGIKILLHETYFKTDTVDDIRQRLRKTIKKARIFLPLGGGAIEMYIPFLQAFQAEIDPPLEYAALISQAQYRVNGLPHPWESDPSMVDALLNVFFMYNKVYEDDAVDSFISRLNIGTDWTDEEMTVYLQEYEAAHLYSALVEMQNTAIDGRRLINGMNLHSVSGPFGDYFLNENSHRISPFRVVRLIGPDLTELEMANISVVQVTCAENASMTCASLKGVITNDSRKTASIIPADQPACGFNNEYCDQRGAVLAVYCLLAIVTILILTFYVVRRANRAKEMEVVWNVVRKSVQIVKLSSIMREERPEKKQEAEHRRAVLEQIDKQLARGPLPVNAAILAKTAAIQQQALEPRDKRTFIMPPRSRLAVIDNDFVMAFCTRVIVKHDPTVEEVAILRTMRKLSHTNLLDFRGVTSDKSFFYCLWGLNVKGDVLQFLESQREREQHSKHASMMLKFKASFVRDLLRGLEHLHQSEIGYHGSLVVRNCLIDSNWILKLANFGMQRLLVRWIHKNYLDTEDKDYALPNSELYYYAPEVRAFWKTEYLNSIPDSGYMTTDMAVKGDIFSLGKVLYEILYERKFATMKDVPKKTPDVDTGGDDQGNRPLFDFSVEQEIPETAEAPDDDDIHNDLRNHMRRCWDRDPEKRPKLTLMRRITDSTLKVAGAMVDQMIRNLNDHTNRLEAIAAERSQQVAAEQESSEAILSELLPPTIIREVRAGRIVEPREYRHTSVLYSDIVGFTSLCSQSSPIEVVSLLSGIFQAFDNIIAHHSAYKVETIGDAYMIASGVPVASKNHVKNIASIALMNRAFLNAYEIPHRKGQYLKCRWGFHSGPVYAGIVGVNAPRYCIFGQTVAIASKMENMGQENKIQLTAKSCQLLTNRYPEYKCTLRGIVHIEIEGLSSILTYWLDGVEELIASVRSKSNKAIKKESLQIAKRATRKIAFEDGYDTTDEEEPGITLY